MKNKKLNDPNVVTQQRRDRTQPKAALTFPLSRQIPYGTAIQFKEYVYDISGSKANIVRSISEPAIFLPLPQQLVDTLNIGYQNNDIGAAGQLFRTGVNFGRAAGGDTEALRGTGNILSQTPAYIARSLLSNVVSSLGAAIDLKTGNVPNPYTIATFDRVEVRQHNFTWKLNPTSAEESNVIREITDKLRMSALPSKNGLFLKMPDEVEILFFGSQYLYGFARATIRSIQVNYSGHGTPSFFGETGAPTSVELIMTVGEIEQLTRESFTGNAQDTAAAETLDAGLAEGVETQTQKAIAQRAGEPTGGTGG